jgi:hypothetical protein
LSSPQRFKESLLFSVTVITASLAFSQPADLQSWNAIQARYDFSKKWRVLAEFQIRLDQEFSHVNSFFPDAGVAFRPIENLELSANYRMVFSEDFTAHRLYTDVSYEWKSGDWELKPRIRFQHEEKRFAEAAENYLRPRITLQFSKVKNLDLFLASEWFYHVLYYRGDLLDEYRLIAGIEYEWSKQLKSTVAYFYNREINVAEPERAQIISLALNIRLN